MDTQPMNRRQAAKARTRALVLEKGAELFRTVGYEAATIRDIAKACGMSTGAVFANFTDKADLYLAIFGHPPITPEQGRSMFEAGVAGDQVGVLRIAEAIAKEGVRLKQERLEREAEAAKPKAHAVREQPQGDAGDVGAHTARH